MSALFFEDYVMPSASIGRPNPLPDLRSAGDAHAAIAVDRETVSPEESEYMGWGRVNGILPYLLLDGYDRKKKPRAWKAAILENEHIRAVFMPELGGRMWSLIDKDAGRELLHRNPVFQPANLALRGAWISGGVEWNVGIIGHTPFTVDRMFTESLELGDGTPVLRMYEYERVRRLVYRVEALLPEGSRQLFVRVRIDNASDMDTAVYWWSNIAVDEREDVRVVAPAERSFRYSYGGLLKKIEVPYMAVDLSQLKDGKRQGSEVWDVSRSTQIPQAMDFFFDLPEGRRRFISAIGGDGYGLAQTSTDVLRGRKLFVWGMGDGGRNWQAFLAEPGCAYIEIQAGLARTQLEHLPMKGGQVISWMEAYGPLSADAGLVHGHDWGAAVGEVERALEEACPRAKVEEMLRVAERELDNREPYDGDQDDCKPDDRKADDRGHSNRGHAKRGSRCMRGELVMSGSGWAYVQKSLLGGRFGDGGLAFPASSAGSREAPWLALQKTGALPCPGVLAEPGSYQTGGEWEALLAESIRNGGSDHWYGHYQHGVMLAYRGRLADAAGAFDRSCRCAPNPWALYCKAVLCQIGGDDAAAAQLLTEAVRMLPERNIAKEALIALGKAKRPAEAIRLYGSLPARVRALGRLKALYIEALLDTGDYKRAGAMLRRKIEFTDIREGEVMLTELWFRMCAMSRAAERGCATSGALAEEVRRECPPPRHLDFRMQ